MYPSTPNTKCVTGVTEVWPRGNRALVLGRLRVSALREQPLSLLENLATRVAMFFWFFLDFFATPLGSF